MSQQFSYDLLGDSNLVDAVGIFIYTWSFLEIVIADLEENRKKKMLNLYRKLTIFLFPLITYGLYFAVSYFDGLYYFQYERKVEQTTLNHIMKEVNILYACLYGWDCVLVVLSCIHLGLLLW